RRAPHLEPHTQPCHGPPSETAARPGRCVGGVRADSPMLEAVVMTIRHMAPAAPLTDTALMDALYTSHPTRPSADFSSVISECGPRSCSFARSGTLASDAIPIDAVLSRRGRPPLRLPGLVSPASLSSSESALPLLGEPNGDSWLASRSLISWLRSL